MTRTTIQTAGREVRYVYTSSVLHCCVCFSVPLLASPVVRATASADSVVLESRRVCGASVLVITADLDDPGIMVDIGVPQKGIYHSAPFLSMVKLHAPVAAVTGTYFDVGTSVPVGTIVIGGKKVYTSCIGSAVCFYRPNRVEIQGKCEGEDCDFPGAECGLRTGPRLLASGGVCASSPQRRLRQPGLFRARARMALGVTPNNKLLLVAVRTPVTFDRLASVMKSLGASDAASLDGGSSSAMSYRGRVVRWPGRRLTNIIEIRQAPGQGQGLETGDSGLGQGLGARDRLLGKGQEPGAVDSGLGLGSEPAIGPSQANPPDVFEIGRQDPNPPAPDGIRWDQESILPDHRQGLGAVEGKDSVRADLQSGP